jgi:hypothetical protein
LPLTRKLLNDFYYGNLHPVSITLAGRPSSGDLVTKLLARTSEMIRQVHSGDIKAGDIDLQTTRLTHEILMDGVTKKLKVDWNTVDYESENGQKLKALQTHVFRFSACKNYEEVQALSRSLIKDGKTLSFDEFRNEAAKIDSTFNGSWLRTEYDQAQVTATRIADHNRMEEMRDLYPTWQYKTRADGHVREPHQALHNMKLASNDPAWASIYPPNGWNCRCWVEPLSDDAPAFTQGQEAIGKLQKTVVSKKTGMSEWDNMVRQGFNQNPAVTGSVYPKNHPYFRSAGTPAVKTAVDDFSSPAFEELRKWDNGGKIEVHSLVDRKKKDFSDLVTICSHFAGEGKQARILPKINYKDPLYNEIYGKMKGTPYERKCPDFSVDGQFYEYESFSGPETKRTLKNMLSRGIAQAPRVVLSALRNATDNHILKVVNDRVIRQKQKIDEVWIVENEKIRNLYKRR